MYMDWTFCRYYSQPVGLDTTETAVIKVFGDILIAVTLLR